MASLTEQIVARSRRRARATAGTSGQVTVVSRKAFREMQTTHATPAPELRAVVEARKSRSAV